MESFPRNIRNIIFDLDGTLTDPSEGITKSIRYALESTGFSSPPEKELLWCIGPPLLEDLKILMKTDDEELLERAVYHFRIRYRRIGKYENRVYPQIEDMLKFLKQKNFNLFIATTKLQSFADDILAFFGLAHYFTKVMGSELDGTFTNKALNIAEILKTERIDVKTCVMIGDRFHDIVGAKKNNIFSVGVLWGFGSRKELEQAGADLIIEIPGKVEILLTTKNTNKHEPGAANIRENSRTEINSFISEREIRERKKSS